MLYHEPQSNSHSISHSCNFFHRKNVEEDEVKKEEKEEEEKEVEEKKEDEEKEGKGEETSSLYCPYTHWSTIILAIVSYYFTLSPPLDTSVSLSQMLEFS